MVIQAKHNVGFDEANRRGYTENWILYVYCRYFNRFALELMVKNERKRRIKHILSILIILCICSIATKKIESSFTGVKFSK